MSVAISEREDEVNVKLRATRENLGLTQLQVAEKANIAERAYQNYEYGKRNPSVRTAIRIAKALNSSVEELFQKTQSEPDGNQT